MVFGRQKNRPEAWPGVFLLSTARSRTCAEVGNKVFSVVVSGRQQKRPEARARFFGREQKRVKFCESG